MARKRRNQDGQIAQTTTTTRRGGNDGTGYSIDALDALVRGDYGKQTGRQVQYHTSEEQTLPVRNLPVLKGVSVPTSDNSEWESSFSRKNYVDTDNARRKYEQRIGHTPTSEIQADSFEQYDKDMKKAEFIARTNGQSMPEMQEVMKNMPSYTLMPEKERKEIYNQSKTEKPSSKYQNNVIAKSVSQPKKSTRDKSFDKDFDEFYDYRAGDYLNVVDYDPEKDADVEHWRNLKQDIMKKNNWSEKEFDKRWNEYYDERNQEAADTEVKMNLQLAKEHPILGTIGQFAYTPQTWVEGAMTEAQGASAKLGQLTGWNPLKDYTPTSASAPQFTGTRVKEGVKQEVRDNHIDTEFGKFLYNAGTGAADMGLSLALPGGATGTALSKASNKQMQALERGVDPEKAARTAALQGINGYIMGKIGLDKVFGAAGKTPIRGVLKGGLIEGAENVVEDWVDYAIDAAINGDKSELATLHDYYVKQGGDENAWWKVIGDKAEEATQSFGSGVLTGGTFNAVKNLPELKSYISSKGNKNLGIVPEEVARNLQGDVGKVPEVTPQKLQNEVGKADATSAPETKVEPEKLQTEVEKPVSMNPKDVAQEYRDVIATYDLDKGYYDTEELDNIAKELEEDIVNGEDLTRHVEALEDFMGDADDFELLGRMTELAGKLNDIQSGKVTETPKTNYTPEQQAVVDGYKNAEDSSITTWINNVRSGKKAMKYKPVATESNATADYVQNELGIDIHGNKVGFTKSFLNHDTNEHMSGGKKSQITDADLAKIGYVIENPDDIVVTGRTSSSKNLKDDSLAPTIAMRKRIDGNYYIIEAVTDAKAKEDVVINAFIEEVGKETQEYKDLFSHAYHVANAFDNTASKPLPNARNGHENSVTDISTSNVTPESGNVNRTMNEGRPAPARSTAEIPSRSGNNGGNDVPHVNGTMPNDGQTKTSGYYDSTMRNTPTNAEMSDAEYGKRFNEDEYGYITSSHAETDARSNEFIQKAGGDEAAIDKLLNEDFEDDEKFDSIHVDAAEKLADKVERQAQELEAQGQDATEQWILANRLHKKIRENATLYAKGLEILKKWKQSTPQGQVDYIVTEVNKSVDNKKTKGYTKMVNKVADKVEDAILNGKDKKTVTDNVKKIFDENRNTSDYDTEKYEQLVLDLIGGEDFGMRSPASIAEEAGALIKRTMGVSSLTAKQERAMIDLFEQASHYTENSRSYNECISRAMAILDSTMPSSLGDKVKSVMYDNMLSSLKTMLTRNLGGNVLANAIETTSRPLQVLADIAASKFTGNRTRTLTGKSIVEGGKGFAKGVNDWRLDVKNGVDTTRSGQDSLEDALRAVHKTFKTQSDNKVIKGINKVLGGYDRIVRKGMELGDRPIYEMRYAATKAELLDVVDKFGDEGLRKGIKDGRNISTDELIELIAVNEGLEAVLQNDSTMKKGAQALKKAIAHTSEDILGVDVATMSTVPFVEVPANMASRFFQYTPFGIIGNTVRSIKEKNKYGAVNQRRMTGEAGRNALGTLMAGGALGLAGANMISDPYSEDKDEKKVQQNNDYMEYALQTPGGEKQIDLSDVPVLGPMLRYGKMEYDAYKDGGIPALLANIPRAAGSATIDTLYQGLNKLTGSTEKYNSDTNILGNAKNALATSIGSMTNPALIRQTAQFLDENKRDLGDYGTSEYNKNLIINGIPVLREMMLNPKVGTSGEPVKQNGGEKSLGKFLNTYLAPWKVSTPKENMSAAQRYAETLKEQTGGKVNPQPPVFSAKDLKGIKGYDEDNYTHDDLYEIDNKLYKYNNDLANKLINDTWYRSLSPEKQGKYLDTLYSAGKEIVKENYVHDKLTPEELANTDKELYTASSKLSGILKEDDKNLSGMKEYFHNVDGIENLEQKYGYKMDYDNYVKWQTDPEKMALGGAEKYCQVHDRAKELNMTVENYLKAESEYAGGAEQRAVDAQQARDLGFLNKDGNLQFGTYETAVQTVGKDPNKLAFYQNYKKQEFPDGTNQKVPYVMNSPLTNAERAKLITNATDPSQLTGAGITGAYNVGGWDGVWYWRQAQYLADTQFGDGNGSVKKDEKNALLDALYDVNNPYIPNMPDEIYNYLVDVPNKQW